LVKPVVAPSGERLKVLDISLLVIATKPSFSVISDLNTDGSINQSVLTGSFLEQNEVEIKIRIQIMDVLILMKFKAINI